MPPPARKNLWRNCRRAFRWCRITFLLLVLSVIGGLIYLNQAGFPNFVKARLVAELHDRGLDLEFRRLRLRWYHGLVAESVNLGRAANPRGPQLFIDEVALKLDHAALKQFHFQIDSLLIRQGRVVWPLISSNGPPRRFSLDQIMTVLRFLPNDRWELDQFQAVCLGAKIHLTGTLTNASALRLQRSRAATKQTASSIISAWESQLIRVVKLVEKMRFSAPPEIDVIVQGDALDAASFSARLNFHAKDAGTPWGALENVSLNARWTPSAGTDSSARSELKFRVEQAKTPWGEAKQIHAGALMTSSLTNPVPTGANWELDLNQIRSRWGEAQHAHVNGRTIRQETNATLLQTELTLNADDIRTSEDQAASSHLIAQLTHSMTNFTPTTADWHLSLDKTKTRWGDAQNLQLSGHLSHAVDTTPAFADAALGWWAKLEPFQLDWEAQAREVASPKLQLQKLNCAGQWRAPEFNLTKLHVELYDGQLDSSVKLNVATRELLSQSNLDFDPHKISPLLTTNAQRWLNQFSWETPPKVSGQAQLTLPSWTNRHPNWREEVLPTLLLQGNFQAQAGGFRGVPATAAQSDFTFTNFVWHLPNLRVTRPEGRLDLVCLDDTRTQEYHWQISSAVDVKALKPLLDGPQQKVLDDFQFTAPPIIQGEIWGRWHERETIGLAARVALTNFVFRGESADQVQAAVVFTNLFFNFNEVKVIRVPGEEIIAPSAGFDVEQKKLYFTNALSTVEPFRFARVIGPKTLAAITPYKFAKPPTAKANGSLIVGNATKADLHFDVAGGPFNYWKFNVPQINGRVDWVGDSLTLTNVEASFYNGRLTGSLEADFSPANGTDIHFKTSVSEADLHRLMSDLTTPTNHLEGILNANLTITSANSSDWQSWQGQGDAKFREGFLWDIPLFGVFSPVLNAVSDGLGSSRPSSGSATFNIKQSIIHTDDLEIRSLPMRLKYQGTVDFNGRVDARVEAAILRDAWVVGRVFSLAFTPLTKLFENKVTGTLNQPKTEPLFIPKFLMFPFHPFRTLKELFPSEASTPNSSEPPTPKPNDPPP